MFTRKTPTLFNLWTPTLAEVREGMVEDCAAEDWVLPPLILSCFSILLLGLENYFDDITDCCYDILNICGAEELAKNNILKTTVILTY